MVANRFRSRLSSIPFPLVERGHGKGHKTGLSHSSMAAFTLEKATVSLPPAAISRARHMAGIRGMIADSGVVEMLIGYVEGRVEMESQKVTAALNLLKKVVPDLSSIPPPPDLDGSAMPEIQREPLVEFRIVVPTVN